MLNNIAPTLLDGQVYQCEEAFIILIADWETLQVSHLCDLMTTLQSLLVSNGYEVLCLPSQIGAPVIITIICIG